MFRNLSRLDRYLMRQIAVAATVITLSLTFIVWITQSLKLVDFIVNRGIPVSTFIYLALLTLPGLLPVILPLTVFAAVLFIFYRLNSDSELVVMHSGGLSAWRISRSPLIFALIMTAFTYLLTLYLTPLSYTAFKNLQFRLRNDYSLTLLEEGVFTQVSKGITVFIRERQSDGSLHGILVHDNRDINQPVTVLAESGVLSLQRGDPVISVIKGSRQVLNHKNNTVSMLYFDSYTLNLNQIMNAENADRAADPKEMGLGDLFFPGANTEPRTQMRYQAIAHQRLISPLSILVFCLIALATYRHCMPRRQGSTIRLGATIGTVIGLQGLFLIFYNMLGSYSGGMFYALLALNYLLPIGIIFYCLYLLQLLPRIGATLTAIQAAEA
ncbi:MAG: LPS export ABC transporter permease LptF [Alphaproteobacteria bacterium]|nr:MAG: LPS export ABC transporter permease LptF [Alphaproteobacteria bacterium]